MPLARLQDCTEDVVALVRRWLDASAGTKPDAGAVRLARALADDDGLDFALGFLDRVVRPSDPRVAAAALERISDEVPESLSWVLRGAVAVGGGVAALAPWAVGPSARRVLRRMAGHLVVDATPARLGGALTRLVRPGTTIDLLPLGPAVLGGEESDRRLRAATDLLGRSDLDLAAVTLAVRDVVPQRSAWDVEQTVERAVDRLVPVLRTAVGAPGTRTLTLDVPEPGDLDVTVAVFRGLLDRPEFLGATARLTLPTAVPAAEEALEQVTAWARARRGRGGAAVTVRIDPRWAPAADRAAAAVDGRPAITWGSIAETRASALRVTDRALDPARTDAVRVGFAGQDLFDVATAWVLAGRRGVSDALDVEAVLGMTANHLDAVRVDVDRVVLSVPVVDPDAFPSSTGHLASRLQELADPEGPLAEAFAMDTDPAAADRAEARWRAVLAAAGSTPDVSALRQDRRRRPPEPEHRSAFRSAPGTDPSTPGNRAWATDVLRRVPRSQLGVQTIAGARVLDRTKLERIVTTTAQAGLNWGRQDPYDRAELLDLIGHELETRRTDLVEVSVAETGITLTEADGQVTRAVDAAHHAADRARHLGGITGARFVPPRLGLVLPPASSPITTPVEGVTALLAAGAGVILKPSRRAKRSGGLVADVLWDAGVPHSLLQLVDLADDVLGRQLVAHPAVDRVVLTGSADTARAFRWWRAGLPLTASLGGVGTAVVTPSADLDQAVRDVVASAFAQAGQARPRVSVLVLVGSVADDESFRQRLLDAVRSVRVAWPDDPSARTGPLVEPPTGDALAALTELGPGERWLLEPAPLEDSGRLWSPGVREGVRPDGDPARAAQAVPVLDLVRVDTLDEAIAVQDRIGSGLTASVHTLDVDEVETWTTRVHAGSLFVNRAVTDTVPGRQVRSGWGSASVGTTTAPGGSLHVATLGRWEPLPRVVHESIRLVGLPPRPTALIDAARSGLSFAEFDQVRAGARSDVRALEAEFGRSHDPAGLGVERNVLRWRPQSVIVRHSEGAAAGDLVRVLVAATAARAHVLLSTAKPLPGPLTQLLAGSGSPLDVVDHLVESDEAWLARAASGQVFQERWSTDDDTPADALDVVLTQSAERPERPARSAFGGPGSRIRLVGGDPLALEEALGATTDTAIHSAPVLDEGLLEMLPFLREQSVSVTAHRFGVLDPAFAAVRL